MMPFRIPEIDLSPEIIIWFLPGLITGIVITLVLWFALRAMGWSRRRRANQIHIPGENGDVFLSERASRDIVIISLSEFRDIEVHRVQVRRQGKRYVIRVDFSFDPRMAFNSGKEKMKNKLREDFREMIGVRTEIHPILNVIGAESRHQPPEQESDPHVRLPLE